MTRDYRGPEKSTGSYGYFLMNIGWPVSDAETAFSHWHMRPAYLVLIGAFLLGVLSQAIVHCWILKPIATYLLSKMFRHLQSGIETVGELTYALQVSPSSCVDGVA